VAVEDPRRQVGYVVGEGRMKSREADAKMGASVSWVAVAGQM
jgi:hypothetical protein